jgi:hypothetical protein
MADSSPPPYSVSRGDRSFSRSSLAGDNVEVGHFKVQRSDGLTIEFCETGPVRTDPVSVAREMRQYFGASQVMLDDFAFNCQAVHQSWFKHLVFQEDRETKILITVPFDIVRFPAPSSHKEVVK